MALDTHGIEAEVLPVDDVYFFHTSFSICVRKYKEFGRYVESMPFFNSKWNETINATSDKAHEFSYYEELWPYPVGLSVGEGCKNCDSKCG